MFNVNEYFDGKVKSFAFENNSGAQTVGVMAPGDFEFGTSTIEIMTVVSGKLTVQLPGNESWKTYLPGDSFEVAKDVKFKVKIEEPSSYLCLYK
ncbi:MAG: pyrimidine/purine nucleoside phosphorylase [Bacteroidales bacterium]|nr:pyrimidine/purine nucleoside phosphorylase [Bacteroidales bacterium]